MKTQVNDRITGAVLVEVYSYKEEKSQWLPGQVTGHIAGDADEDFDRINVQLADGRAFVGCHPNCIRQHLPFEIKKAEQLHIF